MRPHQLEVLTSKDEVVKWAACGDEHSLFLTEVGELGRVDRGRGAM